MKLRVTSRLLNKAGAQFAPLDADYIALPGENRAAETPPAHSGPLQRQIRKSTRWECMGHARRRIHYVFF